MTYTRTVFLPVTPEQAFGLLTQPERLRRWMTITARIDLRAGGEFRWTVVPGAHAAGTVTEIEPGRRIAFTWGWEGNQDALPGTSDLSITLEPADGGTTLTLVHAGLGPEQEGQHAQGWNHYLDRLVSLAAAGDAGPDAWGVPGGFDRLTAAEASWAVLSRALTWVIPEDSGRSTPCEGYDIAALTVHLRDSITGIATALGSPMPADDAKATTEARMAAAVEPTLEALARRGLDGEIDMGFAVLPALLVANILNLELLVHAWDYTTSLGRPLDIAAGLSDYVLGLARETISDQVRANGSFGPETLVEESAHSLDRLIAFTGRVPSHG